MEKIFCQYYQNYLRHLWLKFFIFRLVEGGFLKELFIKHYENLMNHHKRISICLFFKILQLNRKNYVNNWSKTNKNFPISGLLASFPEQMNIMCLVFFMYFAINWSYAASKIIFSKNMQPLSKYFRKHLKTAIFSYQQKMMTSSILKSVITFDRLKIRYKCIYVFYSF